MLKPEMQCNDTSGDPQPAFATDAEIATAQRLWRQIEERYLAAPAPPSPPGPAEVSH